MATLNLSPGDLTTPRHRAKVGCSFHDWHPANSESIADRQLAEVTKQE